MEAIDRFQFGGWDSYYYLNCKMEAEAEAVEAEAEAVKAAQKLTASTSLVCLLSMKTFNFNRAL